MPTTPIPLLESLSTLRRVPSQERSRARVERILDEAARLVAADGVDAVTTRSIANAAGLPVASFYQYFSDKEGVLVALAERDMAEMDEQVALDLAALDELSIAALVETTMRAFVTVYHRRRAFVEIYLRGRTNSTVHEFGRHHNLRIAQALRAFAIENRLVADDVPEKIAVMAVEIGDRIFQLAFAEDDHGDPLLLDEGIAVMTAVLQRHALPEHDAPASNTPASRNTAVSRNTEENP